MVSLDKHVWQLLRNLAKPTDNDFVESFNGSLREECLKLIILIALYTGLRHGEILRLRWDDIDFETCLLLVKQSKNGRSRRVNLNTDLCRGCRKPTARPRVIGCFPT